MNLSERGRNCSWRNSRHQCGTILDVREPKDKTTSVRRAGALAEIRILRLPNYKSERLNHSPSVSHPKNLLIEFKCC